MSKLPIPLAQLHYADPAINDEAQTLPIGRVVDCIHYPTLGCPALLTPEQAGLVQHFQMVADRGLRERQRFDQIADTSLAAGTAREEAEQPKPGRIGNGPKRGREEFGLGLRQRTALREGWTAFERGNGDLHTGILTHVNVVWQDGSILIGFDILKSLRRPS